jgi:SnoaL-like domain
MNSIKHNLEHTYATVNKSIVYEYFRLIKNKDIDGILNLFNENAVIYEPFSNIEGGLQGKSAIRPFFDVVLMANDGLQYKIEFVKAQDGSNNENKEDSNNQVTALVTFERGGTVQGQFTFKLRSEEEEPYHYRGEDRAKKIQTLHIEFIK